MANYTFNEIKIGQVYKNLTILSDSDFIQNITEKFAVNCVSANKNTTHINIIQANTTDRFLVVSKTFR